MIQLSLCMYISIGQPKGPGPNFREKNVQVARIEGKGGGGE